MIVVERLVLPLILIASLLSESNGDDSFRRIAKFSHPVEGARRITGGREVEFSDDGTKLIVAFYGSQVQIFDLENNKPIAPAVVTSGDGEVGFVNNELFYTADWTSVRIWDAQSGQQVGEPAPHELREDTIIPPAFSPDSKRIATRATMKSFQIMDLATRNRIGQVQTFDSAISSLSFSTDGELLFARTGGKLFVYNANSGQRVAGPYSSGWRFYYFVEKQSLITTEQNGDGPVELVIRSTALKGWPEIHRSKIAGRLKRLVPLEGNQLFLQATRSNYTPELFTFSLQRPDEREIVDSDADRAFHVVVTDDKRHWICSNIRDIRCQKFGDAAPIWKTTIAPSGSDQHLFPFDNEHFIILNKKGLLGVHKVSDGLPLWTQEEVNRFQVFKERIAICNREGVEIWSKE